MKRLFQFAALTLLPLLLLGAECERRPVDPTAVGGAPAAGGYASTGGSLAIGGQAPIAGAPAQTGGTSTGGAATGGDPAVQFPTACDYGTRRAPTVRPSLSGWRKDPARAKRRKARASYQIVAPSVFRVPNSDVALDQGSLGSCTGNAVAQCLSTHPFGGRLLEADAIRIYSRATEIDPWQGAYPPTDTGSNGSSAWQAAIDLGYYSGAVTQVETLEELQGALQRVPCPVGVDWWSGMFTPTASGELQMTGTIEGGHELEVIGWDAERKAFWIRNSWGPGWGVCRGAETGYAYFSAGTLQKLLNAGGEIDCPASAP